MRDASTTKRSTRRAIGCTSARFCWRSADGRRPRPLRRCCGLSERSDEMSAESRSLTAVVARIIELQRDVPRINPTAVASAALLELDPKKVSVPAVLAGCHLALRQIARRLLRQRFEDASDEEEDDVEPE